MGNSRTSAGSSGPVAAEEQQQLVTRDEAEEVDAEVREHVAHRPVGVHGAADDLSGDPRQQERSGQHRGLALLLHLGRVAPATRKSNTRGLVFCL